MRSKEHAHDYRYFPEPDLVPLRVSEGWLERIRESVPELPADKRKRFVESYGLREYDAQVLTATRAISDYFEKTAAVAGDPRTAANWVTGDLMGALEGRDIAEAPVPAERLGELVSLIAKGEISGKLAKDIFAKMISGGESARTIIDREGLRQISDTDALGKIVDDVIAGNPKQVEQYKSGKTAVLGYLVGQVMKASKGQANPGAVNELLKTRLQ
jgi:aspartyl-tRNA(Asn)/glutamyl-tRNA(Gln) amidotransferase subunit B